MLVRLRSERLGNCRIDAPAAIWRNRTSHWFSPIQPLFYVAAYNNAGGMATYVVKTRQQAEFKSLIRWAIDVDPIAS